MDRDTYLTVEQAAERIQAHVETVRRWLREGKISGTLISRRAGYRIAAGEVDRFLKEGPREAGKLAA